MGVCDKVGMRLQGDEITLLCISAHGLIEVEYVRCEYIIEGHCTFVHASTWCWRRGAPAIGNKGMGTSRERGRNCLPG